MTAAERPAEPSDGAAAAEEAEFRRIPTLAKLRRLANLQKFEDLEPAWVEALAAGEIPAAELVPVAGQVGRLGEKDKAASMLWLLLSTVEEKGGAAPALAVARQAAGELPEAAALRDELCRLYPAVHADHPDLPALLHLVLESDLALPEAVAAADAYVSLRPGAFLRESRHYDPGLVERVDARSGALTVRFGERHEEYRREQLPQLQPLPADHFRSLSLYAPERVRELAVAQPAAFVREALGAAKEGRLTYKELKTQVVALLGEKGWTAWWGEARTALKRDPRLEVSGASQPSFRLLAGEHAYEDRLRAQFDGLSDPGERLRLVLAYLDETLAEHPADPALLSLFGSSVARLAMDALSADPALALAGLAVHAEVAARGAAVPRPGANAAATVLAKVTEPDQLPRRFEERLLRSLLEYVRTSLPDRWAAVWAAMLPRAGRRLGESMARELAEAGHEEALIGALREVVARPTGSPDMLCWIWSARRRARQGAAQAALAALPEQVVFEAMLALADTTGRLCAVSDEERHHKVLAQVQQALAGPGAQPLRDIAAAVDQPSARRLREAIAGNGGLTVTGRNELLAHLRAVHPEVFVAVEKPWEEDAIYTTAEGLERRRQEFEHLAREELPAVAKQIGEAAAHGDLSENAEYKAALEKRDFVTTRAAQIENELARAKLIQADMAASAFVNIGTRVRTRELGGARETIDFVFLGPWEADPERHVLNYNAPLALAFMGRRPGDVVEFGDGPERRRWQIEAVEPALQF